MGSLARVVLAATLVVLGLLSCAYGGLLLAAIPVSDTATASLIVYGLVFAVPGLAAVGIGVWLLRQAHRARNSRPR